MINFSQVVVEKEKAEKEISDSNVTAIAITKLQSLRDPSDLYANQISISTVDLFKRNVNDNVITELGHHNVRVLSEKPAEETECKLFLIIIFYF